MVWMENPVSEDIAHFILRSSTFVDMTSLTNFLSFRNKNLNTDVDYDMNIFKKVHCIWLKFTVHYYALDHLFSPRCICMERKYLKYAFPEVSDLPLISTFHFTT